MGAFAGAKNLTKEDLFGFGGSALRPSERNGAKSGGGKGGKGGSGGAGSRPTEVDDSTEARDRFANSKGIR